MKRIIIICALLISASVSVFGQAEMKPGYVIKANGAREECQIRDDDWRTNPTRFRYALQSNPSDILTGTIEDVKEFAIASVRYIRAEVSYDNSSDIVGQISETKAPLYEKRTVFLKELVSGSPALYQYTEATKDAFYYSTDGLSFVPLVHKQYKLDFYNVAENNTYRNQLNALLPSEVVKGAGLESLPYTAKALSALFEKANGTHQPAAEIEVDGVKKPAAKPGLYVVGSAGLSSATLYSYKVDILEPDYEPLKTPASPLFSFGIEFEYPLPFRANKMAIAMETSYFHYSTKLVEGRDGFANINALRIPFSFRYYIFLQEKTRLYADFFAGLDIPVGTTIFINQNYMDEIHPALLYGAGAGCSMRNFRLGIKYTANGNYLSRSLRYDIVAPTWSIVVAYKFL